MGTGATSCHEMLPTVGWQGFPAARSPGILGIFVVLCVLVTPREHTGVTGAVGTPPCRQRGDIGDTGSARVALRADGSGTRQRTGSPWGEGDKRTPRARGAQAEQGVRDTAGMRGGDARGAGGGGRGVRGGSGCGAGCHWLRRADVTGCCHLKAPRRLTGWDTGWDTAGTGRERSGPAPVPHLSPMLGSRAAEP